MNVLSGKGLGLSVLSSVLFALMLVAAALGMLALLVAGPGLALPVGIAAAAGLMGLVAVAWAVAGPRL